ncbi:AAA family ATPase [Nostoc sp.]|uniref:AAA family ATPase n=1 Tax=Nostoc sp. TaxID=1180 RepID=UPI002FF466AD
MLSKLRVEHYKSLFNTEVALEPLTVFIGPNGSGKSNICEALAVLSNFLQRLLDNTSGNYIIDFFAESLKTVSKNQPSIESKFWHGKLDYFVFEVSTLTTTESIHFEKAKNFLDLSVHLDYPQRKVCLRNIEKTRSQTNNYTTELREFLVSNEYSDSPLADKS